MRRSTTLLLLLFAAGWVVAADDMPAPEAGPHQTILVGRMAIVPSDAKVTPSTTVDFQNMTLYPLTIRFTSPDDMKSKLSGSHLGQAGAAPWLMFNWDWENRLVASLDPGRVASLCCFAPGFYSFNVYPTFRGSSGGPSGILPMNGTITVK